MVEEYHRWRFSLFASVLSKYLMLKLQLFAGSLLRALDHSEFSFRKE